MAEGGDIENRRSEMIVRLMQPYPPRPFEAYDGPPVAAGRLVTIRQVFEPMASSWHARRHLELLLLRNNIIMQRVDCVFDPYSEMCLSASVDLQSFAAFSRLVTHNDGPLNFMSQFSIDGENRFPIPYRRSKISTSTAFCSDGSTIAWPGYSSFDVYDSLENIRRTVPDSACTLCGAFSPDERYLALLSAENDLLQLKIFENNSLSFVVGGFTYLEFISADRPSHRFFEDNPAHLLWSKCGRYLGVSTYFREMVVFKVKLMIDFRESRYCLIPKLSHHPDFERISHPRAYDFASIPIEPEDKQEVTTLALGTILCHVRLYEVLDDKLGEMIDETDIGSWFPVVGMELVINCIRFSHSKDLLAVALSNGVVELLDSVSLVPIRSLQQVQFDLRYRPKGMPYYHGFSSLSFACSDNFLAAGTTNNAVYVWCIQRRVGPLLALCRTAVRSYCSIDDMHELPVPPDLLTYLTDIAF